MTKRSRQLWVTDTNLRFPPPIWMRCKYEGNNKNNNKVFWKYTTIKRGCNSKHLGLEPRVLSLARYAKPIFYGGGENCWFWENFRFVSSNQRIARALESSPKVVTPSCHALVAQLLSNVETKTAGSVQVSEIRICYQPDCFFTYFLKLRFNRWRFFAWTYYTIFRLKTIWV